MRPSSPAWADGVETAPAVQSAGERVRPRDRAELQDDIETRVGEGGAGDGVEG